MKTPPRFKEIAFVVRQEGAAAAELCLWIALLAFPILNVIDLGRYAFERMQVDLSAQSAVQSIRLSCKGALSPLSKNCATFATAATTGAQSTSLGTGVSVASGYPDEGYYCVNASSALVLPPNTSVGTSSSKPPTGPSPFDCSGVTSTSGAAPGTYLRVKVSYVFKPVFTGLTVTSLLTSPIESIAWLRIA